MIQRLFEFLTDRWFGSLCNEVDVFHQQLVSAIQIPGTDRIDNLLVIGPYPSQIVEIIIYTQTHCLVNIPVGFHDSGYKGIVQATVAVAGAVGGVPYAGFARDPSSF